MEYLSGGRLTPLYRAAMLLAVLAGAVWQTQGVWQLVDLCTALMALPNLTALLLLAPRTLSRLGQKESEG